MYFTRIQGKIGTYYVQRYGFSQDCEVITFTGDNPGKSHFVMLIHISCAIHCFFKLRWLV